MSVELTRAIEVFFSYAHKDEKWRNELENQLSALKRQGLITGWYDRKLSPGIEWASEIDKHLNTASIILLLVSPNFIASDYCYGIELAQAMERHEAGKARVIPVIVRPTDWKETAFGKLQALPTSGRPVTQWRDRDEAFLEIAKGIRKAIEELNAIQYKDQELATLRQQYYNTIYERWKMLDFKGIMHITMNTPISIPLKEVFVLPDVLVGVPEYETLEREEASWSQDYHKKKTERENLSEEEQEQIEHRERVQRKEKRLQLQRENLRLVLAKDRRIVILGDPGSGKSTLLRYILLLLTEGNHELLQLPDTLSVIPLFIPLASYAENWRLSNPGERSLKDFLPKYFHDNYLDEYIDFLQEQLKQGNVFLLLDGLDEILDVSLRMEIVRQVEMFTRSHPSNRFIVTSRIIGYRETQLAAEYQAYTLADFSQEQTRSFTRQWCPSYERWVKGTTDNQYFLNSAIKDAENLFEAIQRKTALKKLAVNPLLLTILALIQRQGIELPSHRIELFDLCTSTLLDTWITAKGPTESKRFTKNDLFKILPPLAFWMHEHSSAGAIPEDELIEQIIKQLLVLNITRHEDKAVELGPLFFQVLHEKTGILIERSKLRFSFLHLTFEEYFSARELAARTDRNDFIKTYLHDARWREVILLAAGTIGILQKDKEEINELTKNNILNANSRFESWLHRDLLFAGLCLADDVGVSPSYEDEIVKRIVYSYITNPYDSLRDTFSNVLNLWQGTELATKVSDQVLPALLKRETMIVGWIPVKVSLTDTSSLEELITIHYQHLILRYKESQIRLLRLRLIIALCHLPIDTTAWTEYALAALSDSDTEVRQAAAIALGQLGNGDPHIIDALLLHLYDPSINVRQAVAIALGQVGGKEAHGALLPLLTDSNANVRQAAAIALGQVGGKEANITNISSHTVSDASADTRQVVAKLLGQVGSEKSRAIDTLHKLLKGSNRHVRQTTVVALGQLGSERPYVIDALLPLLTDSNANVRQAVATSLGQAGSGQPRVINALLQFLFDSNTDVKQAAATALEQQARKYPHIVQYLWNISTDKLLDKTGLMQKVNTYGLVLDRTLVLRQLNLLKQIGSGQLQVSNTLLRFLSSSDWHMREAAVAALGHLGNGEPRVLDALLKLLTDSNFHVRQAAVIALGLAGSGEPRVLDALLKLLANSDANMKQLAAIALGRQGNREPRVIDALLKLLFHPSTDVRQAAVIALGLVGSGEPRVIDALIKLLSDSNIHVSHAAAESLGKSGWEEPSLIDSLLSLLSDFDVGQTAVMALGLVGSGEPRVIDALLPFLSASLGDMRQATAVSLGQLGYGQPRVINALLKRLSDPIWSVKLAVVIALGQVGYGQPDIVDALLKRLSSSDPRMKQAVATALGRLGSGKTRVINALLPLLSDSNPSIKQAAATALGRLGGGQSPVTDALLSRLSDSNADVRQVVAEALLTSSADSEIIAQHVEALLQQYEAIVNGQIVADDATDTLLFTLQQVAGEV